MNKQLRIWLFAFLSTLLTSTTLLAEGVITMTTSKEVGDIIGLRIGAHGDVSIDGAQEFERPPGGRLEYYTLTSQTITIRGDVTYLECRGNNLTSLDVSGCTSLIELSCRVNQLTSLNLSGCTALTELDCSDNPLTSVNLSGCQSLKKFSWIGGRLTSLDVSGCTALTELWCDENELTSLEASGCTALADLTCSNNPLTSINLSGCQSLKKFWWTGGRLTSLDVSGCTALTKLRCWGNQLTSLDVSGCTALTKLRCWGNQLTSLDVSGCTALTTLECYNNEIKGTEMTNLVNSLPDRQGAKEGLFHVFREVKHGDVDGNVCLAAHVATAKAKNWRTLFYHGDKWHDYAGLDKSTFVVTYSSSNGGSISITGADDLQNVPYDTELTVVTNVADGYKLTTLTANGRDILQTKRFKVTENTEVKATFVDHTGVETTVTQQVKLYPNLATDYVIVEGVAPASEVTLHSMTGERLYAGRANSRGMLQIDVTPYADGVYLVCVAGETYRVVVRH